MTLAIRPATETDIPAISALVNRYAAQDLMLPRSEVQVRGALADFLVAVDDQELVGCASLATLAPGLGEIRSLAVVAQHSGQGVGSQIVGALLDLARERGVEKVCSLTLRPSLFQRLGFQVVDQWNLTPKLWGECIYCPKYHNCDEFAVLLNLAEPARAVGYQPLWWRVLGQHMPLPVLRLLARCFV